MGIGGLVILDDRRIDIEGDRHHHGLARLQHLFGEAEAVDLGEIGADLLRRHVVGRRAGDRAVGRAPADF